jgi:hypothetical protein
VNFPNSILILFKIIVFMKDKDNEKQQISPKHC